MGGATPIPAEPTRDGGSPSLPGKSDGTSDGTNDGGSDGGTTVTPDGGDAGATKDPLCPASPDLLGCFAWEGVAVDESPRKVTLEAADNLTFAAGREGMAAHFTLAPKSNVRLPFAGFNTPRRHRREARARADSLPLGTGRTAPCRPMTGASGSLRFSRRARPRLHGSPPPPRCSRLDGTSRGTGPVHRGVRRWRAEKGRGDGSTVVRLHRAEQPEAWPMTRSTECIGIVRGPPLATGRAARRAGRSPPRADPLVGDELPTSGEIVDARHPRLSIVRWARPTRRGTCWSRMTARPSAEHSGGLVRGDRAPGEARHLRHRPDLASRERPRDRRAGERARKMRVDELRGHRSLEPTSGVDGELEGRWPME